MNKAVKIEDIAKALNLSRNTVSKALNGQPLPERTRRMIIAKAVEMNYKSMSLNLNLVNQRKRIALVSNQPFTNVDFFAPITEAIESSCMAMGWQLTRYIMSGSGGTVKSDFLQFLHKLGIDGIICVETLAKETVKTIIESNIPAVFLDCPYFIPAVAGDYDVVFNDASAPINTIVRRLARETGVSAFTFVGDFEHCRGFYERYSAMCQTLFQMGISHRSENDILERDGSVLYEPNYLASRLKGLPDFPECIIAANDFLATNVLEALKKIRIAVPGTCQIVGFDNSRLSLTSSPKITTIGCNQFFLGKEAIDTLIQRIKDPAKPTTFVYIQSKIIFRNTTLLRAR